MQFYPQMGITRLVNNDTCTTLKLSHAVQRLMFWSEAGRNAYKDDGTLHFLYSLVYVL